MGLGFPQQRIHFFVIIILFFYSESIIDCFERAGGRVLRNKRREASLAVSSE